MGKIESAIESMRKNLEEKTGKPFEKWVALARKQAFAKHSEVVAWLKQEHGLTHGYANSIAAEAIRADGPAATEDDLVAAQYAGTKASLKPIYDALIKAVSELGGDVEISPKKTYVSLRRKKQFALIQPTTATRIDVGINLKGVAADGRLEAAGSFNAMVTHRVRVESSKDVNAQLRTWLKQAYEAA